MLERIVKKVWLATFLSQVVVSLTLIGASIPDKVVVLTFDDSIKSHHSVVGPLLKRYGFGATFFITEGFDFKTDKEKYMTWEEIASLHKDGFEIGNHTRDHMGVGEDSLSQLPEQVAAINRRCEEYGIPRPTSFAYPGNAIADGAMAALKDLGFTFARRGGAPEHPYEHGKGFAYEPGLDHPLLIPSAGDARPHWTIDNFKDAVAQAVFGKIAVLQFHGVPDRAHAWVHTPKERFVEYMAYLAENDFEVIALRDLHRYVDATITPNNPNEVIEDRKRTMVSGEGRDVLRTPLSEEDKRYWLSNMIEDHGFDQWETRTATGLSIQDIETTVARYSFSKPQSVGESLKLRPYPGGRHPRIAFRDGAMRPQRETKFSVFAPWKDGGYAVVDVPEAIWVKTDESRELLYLAHTHVPTMWSKNKVSLAPLEWTRTGESLLTIERVLPNKTAFGARIELKQGIVQMNLWLRNGTGQTLTGLNVQNCVMLKELEGFAALNNDNKVFKSPYAASRNESGNRWVITGWERCNRPWANPNCPCLHADPQFPDCAPNDTVELRGVVSFYEGNDIDSEFRRLDSLWRLKEGE